MSWTKKALTVLTKAVLGVVKVVLVMFILLMASTILLDIPGRQRFRRYCSYSDVKALMDAKKDDIIDMIDAVRDGTNYTFAVLKPCRFLASGPAVLVYGPDGRLFDRTRDEGDDGRFKQTWPRPWHWRHAETVRRLKAIKMPEVCFYAPVTMKEFAAYMSQATKDFDSPDLPLEKRGIKFVCNKSVAAKTGPESPKQDAAPIPCPGVGATTAWDALTNVCDSAGCEFAVHSGEVQIFKRRQ